MELMNKTAYSIRLFTPLEAIQYKAMRLEALKNEPGMFGNSYAFEAAMQDEEWLDRVANPRFGRFGLYCCSELVGMTSIVTDAEKPDEAYMTQSYIRKEHRGKGLSKMLYDARIKWAYEHQVKRLTIGHRASNITSKAANQRYGFKYTGREERHWPDGSTEDMMYYELFI